MSGLYLSEHELNRSYNGGGVVYVLKSELSRSSLQYIPENEIVGGISGWTLSTTTTYDKNTFISVYRPTLETIYLIKKVDDFLLACSY